MFFKVPPDPFEKRETGIRKAKEGRGEKVRRGGKGEHGKFEERKGIIHTRKSQIRYRHKVIHFLKDVETRYDSL